MPNAVAIEHFGSTAVPGLDAKPVIDILIGMPDTVLGESQLSVLADLGYEFLGEARAWDSSVK